MPEKEDGDKKQKAWEEELLLAQELKNPSEEKAKIAFETIWMREYDLLVARGQKKYGLSREDAEEVASDALLCLWTLARSCYLKPQYGYRGLLYLIHGQLCTKRGKEVVKYREFLEELLRTLSEESLMVNEEEEKQSSVPVNIPNMSESHMEEMQKFLHKIPEDYRKDLQDFLTSGGTWAELLNIFHQAYNIIAEKNQAFALRCQGLKIKEIAKLLQDNETNVKNYVYREGWDKFWEEVRTMIKNYRKEKIV